MTLWRRSWCAGEFSRRKGGGRRRGKKQRDREREKERNEAERKRDSHFFLSLFFPNEKKNTTSFPKDAGLDEACFQVPYDILVMSVGCTNNTFGVKGVEVRLFFGSCSCSFFFFVLFSSASLPTLFSLFPSPFFPPPRPPKQTKPKITSSGARLLLQVDRGRGQAAPPRLRVLRARRAAANLARGAQAAAVVRRLRRRADGRGGGRGAARHDQRRPGEGLSRYVR